MPFDVAGRIGTVTLPNGIDYTHLSAGPDGNCLFYSVGFLLERGTGQLAGQNRDQMWLRAQATAWIRARAEDVADNATNRQVRTSLGLIGKSATEYETFMNTNKTWGDEFCVYALENCFQVRIEVYQITGAGIVQPANFPSFVSATVLRLVQPPTAVQNYYNHFDPLVSDATGAELIAQRVAPVLGPHEQWQGWLKNQCRMIWSPAVLHTDYPIQQAPVATGLFSVFAGLGRTNTIDLSAPKITNIELTNSAVVKKQELSSPSFSKVDPKLLDVAFRMQYHLPLVMVEDDKAKKEWLEKQKGGESADEGEKSKDAPGFFLATEPVDLTRVKLTLVGQGVADDTAIYFRIYRKGVAEPVGDGPWSTTWADLSKLKGADINSAKKGDRVNFIASFSAADVIPAEVAKVLNWAESPYQLAASLAAAPGDGTAAWTYFHVPSAWDVNTLQAVGHEKAVFLGDLLAPLQGLTGKPPKNPDDLGFTKDQQDAVAKMVANLGDNSPNYNVNPHNIIYGPAGGPYQILSSWASTVILARAGDGLSYNLQSYLYQSTTRRIYKYVPATHGPQADLLATQNQNTQRVMSLLVSYRMKIEAYQLKVVVGRLEPRPFLEAITQAWTAIQRDDAARAYMAGPDALRILGANTLTSAQFDLRTNSNTANIEAAFRQMCSELDAGVKANAANLKNAVTLRPTLEIQGVGDFDSGSPYFGWNQYVAPAIFPVSRAVTGGISSCAGGVTYSMTKDGMPDIVILWHIDGAYSIPVRDLIRQLWPDLEKCPPLRTIAYIYPVASELDKYRKENLYPAEIFDRCETVFLIRGTHIYHKEFVVNCSSNLFGVDVSDPANVSLIFTHDINPHRLGSFEHPLDTELPGMVVDIPDGIYGDYNLMDNPAPDKAALLRFKASLAVTSQKIAADDRIKKASLTCRLPITDAVFKDLAKRGTVASTTGYFSGDKGEQILGRRSLDGKSGIVAQRYTVGRVWKPKSDSDISK